MTQALEHLHKSGLVHRDIKPSNIIFVKSVPKLADIGLVAEISEAKSLVGTAGFIPPEGSGTPSADLFSLGKVLYEMSTGRDRKNFPQLPVTLRELPDAKALVEFNEILLRACEPEARKRYQSAAEMGLDLQWLQDGGSMKRRRTLHRWWAATRRAGVVLGTLAAGAAVFAMFSLARRVHQPVSTPRMERRGADF